MSDPPPANVPHNLPALFDARRYDEVMAHAVLAIQSGDLHPNLLTLLAGVMLNTGWAATPVAPVLEEALAAAPDDSLLLLNLALIFYDEDSAKAWRHLRRFFAVTQGHFPGGGSVRVLRVSSVAQFDHWRLTQDVRELVPSEDVAVTDPYDGAAYTYRSPPVAAVRLPMATIIPGWDFVILQSGEMLNGSGFMDAAVRFNGVGHLYSKEATRAVHPWPRPLIVVDADALFLSAPPQNHFGHWIADFLPRLYAWKHSGNPALKVAVPGDLTQHQRDTLASFGLRPQDMILCEAGRRYRFRSLTVMIHDGYYRVNTVLTKFLYDALGPDPATRPAKPGPGRRIYLERSGTGRGRSVDNGAELDALLDRLGFERMRRPEVAVPRQDAILQDAGVVLTVYGSDVWAFYQLRPGTDLVVLYIDDARELTVESGTLAIAGQCAKLGIRLHRLLCRGAEGDGVRQGYRRDIVVDCAALEECLDGIIERRSRASADGQQGRQ